MKYAIVFWSVTAGCVYKAIMLSGWWLILLWPGISFGLAGMAYAGMGSKIFGKHSDGSLGTFSTAVLLPYLLYTWSLWHIWRLCTREAPYHELYDGVRIGRRLLPKEFPEEVGMVFDLTAEFPEPGSIRGKISYRCYPTLDARPLEPAALLQAAQEILKAEDGVYIHCANGHGRTGTLAGAVLLLGSRSETVEDALEYIRTCRPGATLNTHQRASLAEFAQTIGPRSKLESVSSG
jgi:protein-tyrosine phosphatase